MVAKNTMKVNAPKDIIINLRMKYPNVKDSSLISMMYNTSLLKAEMRLEKINLKDNMGKFVYGRGPWNRIKNGSKKKK